MDKWAKYEEDLKKYKKARRSNAFYFISWTLWAILVGGILTGMMIYASERAKNPNFELRDFLSKNFTPNNVLAKSFANAFTSVKNANIFGGNDDDNSDSQNSQNSKEATIPSDEVEPKEENDVIYATSFLSDTNKEVIKQAGLSLPQILPNKVKAGSFVVGDLDTGEIIFSKRENDVWPIASITKLITALVAMEEIPVHSSVLITRQAVGTLGNSANLKRGERIEAGDLLYPLLLVSSNDSAEAFADHYGRSEFIKKMNEKAVSIGAWHTKFSDPTGLSAKNVSSAFDLFNITKWINDYKPEIFDITSERVKKTKTHTWTNQSHFLNIGSFLGGKIGYTDEALKTATTIFSLRDIFGNHKKIAIVILRSPNRDTDMQTILGYIKNVYGYKE